MTSNSAKSIRDICNYNRIGMYDYESIPEAVNKAGMKIFSIKLCGYKQKVIMGVNIWSV